MQTLTSVAAFGRITGVCLLAGGLGGCYSMGAGGSSGGGAAKVAAAATTTTTTTPTPAKFTALYGPVSAKAVTASGYTDSLYTNTTRMSVDNMADGSNAGINVTPSPTNGAQRQASVGIFGFRPIATDNANLESNGSAVRGSIVNGQTDWVVFSNTPGSRLDASLGASSLEHSYVGVASSRSGVRSGASSDVSFNVAGIFGGRSTSDMPTSGKADYTGGFEGLENASLDSNLRTSNISGKANLTADFAAKTVRGRIDDVKNHSAGPIAQSAGYGIGYNGTITGSNFAGTSWLTQANSDAPLNGFSQSGNLQGGFFGPGAAEAAGGLSALGVDGNRKLLVTGAFGAKKK